MDDYEEYVTILEEFTPTQPAELEDMGRRKRLFDLMRAAAEGQGCELVQYAKWKDCIIARFTMPRRMPDYHRAAAAIREETDRGYRREYPDPDDRPLFQRDFIPGIPHLMMEGSDDQPAILI